MAAVETVQGLRAAKKRETHDAIASAATRLFMQRGFEDVTIAEIAAAARVAKMTVTNYFPRKEDLALDRHEELVSAVAAPVERRAPGESVLAAARAGYAARLATRDPTLGFSSVEWAGMLFGSRALRARLREIHEQAEDALARVLAEQTGDAGLTPRLVAAQLVATERLLLTEALRRSLAGEGADQVYAALAEASREAFERLERGLGDYGLDTAQSD
ncbi:TetR family transcriptional regulator [Pseudonocardia eucalypti]|uniref:TetR family transcriptional regulator n=1 Tax=Pseudonocardia eucalypti TaxID=648755 RepID=A0ABP9QEP8_9PSEU